MKRLSYIVLIGILALAFSEAYFTAQAARPKYTPFEERLRGTVSGGMTSVRNEWTEITGQTITGIGKGTLPGSPVIFTIAAEIRYNQRLEKSFTSGNWTIVASDGQSSISGRFMGTGTNPKEFSGTFKSFNDTATGIYEGKMIYGEFQSQYLGPEAYGEPWRYKALWIGTLKD